MQRGDTMHKFQDAGSFARTTRTTKRGARRAKATLQALGFTLVELLVVISIIIVLVGLLSPVITSARGRAQRLECANNLTNLGKAAMMYAEDYSNRYPWSKRIQSGGAGQLNDDKDARECLELLYKYNYIDNPKVYRCPSSIDEAPEHIEPLQERREVFVLEDHQCSYTYRNVITTTQSSSNTAISGDKRGGEVDPTNHKEGRNVLFKNGNVTWFTTEQLGGDGRDVRQFRRELIGFGMD